VTISSTAEGGSQAGGCHSEPRLVGAQNLASVVGQHFICHSGREDGHNRLAGADFIGSNCLGDEAAKQRSRAYLKLKSLSHDGSSLSDS